MNFILFSRGVDSAQDLRRRFLIDLGPRRPAINNFNLYNKLLVITIRYFEVYCLRHRYHYPALLLRFIDNNWLNSSLYILSSSSSSRHRRCCSSKHWTLGVLFALLQLLTRPLSILTSCLSWYYGRLSFTHDKIHDLLVSHSAAENLVVDSSYAVHTVVVNLCAFDPRLGFEMAAGCYWPRLRVAADRFLNIIIRNCR